MIPLITEIVRANMCVRDFFKVGPSVWSLPQSHTHTHHTYTREFYLAIYIKNLLSLIDTLLTMKRKMIIYNKTLIIYLRHCGTWLI